MSQQQGNFNETVPSSNNFSSNYAFHGNNFVYSNQQLDLPHNNPPDIFTRPPPPVYQNYHHMPQLSVPRPPPLPTLLSHPSPMSVPPPPTPPFSSQSLVQTIESMPSCSEQNYFSVKADSFSHSYLSGPVQHPSHQFQSVPLDTSNRNFISEFSLPLQKVDEKVMQEEDEQAELDCKIHEQWILSWLKSVGRNKGEKIKPKQVGNSSSDLKIYRVKERITDVSKILAELENSCKSLSVIYKSLSYDEWTFRCTEIEKKKKKISHLLGSLMNNQQLVQIIKQKLSKRKKKRERQKRKREEKKQEKTDDNIRRQQLHKNIDRWLEDMKDAVERGRRDEELKREADSVLADVTRKKTEAKRQIALLSTLLKLREARVNAQKAIGGNISQQQTDAFNDVIERLKSLWMKQLKEYSLEEQGLKVMLNEAVAEEKNNQTLKRKEILRDWELAVFGDNKISEYQPHDINEFISIRKQWDQFVVNEGTVMSSSIPPGWVLPVKGEGDWKKYCKT